MGTRFGLTAGLLTIGRDTAGSGHIAIQASGDVQISRDVSGVTLTRQSFAAVETEDNFNTPLNGVVRVRALEDGVQLLDRAIEADGRGDNSAALIEVIAAGAIAVDSPAVRDAAHGPTITRAAAANQIGRGGTVVLQSCQGDVRVATGAQILATGMSTPGTNRVSGEHVTISGLVNPPAVAGATCTAPAPRFAPAE